MSAALTSYGTAGGAPRLGGSNAAPGTHIDKVFLTLICACALLASLVIVLIAVFLFKESFPLVQKIGMMRFLTDDGWWPTTQQYNLVPMIAASLLLTLASTLIATPVALTFAIFMAFYAGPRWQKVLRSLVDISAAVPTIIYAFWGLMTVVPLVNAIASPGASLLAGSLVLALMIFPTITVLSHSAIAAVPGHYFYAGAALGVERASLIRHIVLPSARGGIVAAAILGAARAIGETMVVLVLCGNIVQLPHSFLDPVRALTANIALEMPYAMGDHRAALYVSGMIVLLVVTGLALVSELSAKRQHG
jgi:phosphate transport system permease protein